MNLDKLLAELKQEYIDSLPEKISNIEKLAKKQQWEKVQDSLHKLKGSGKTYGLDELSELAATAEAIGLQNLQTLAEKTPTVIQLLKNVQEKRSQGKPYEIGVDPEFLDLKKTPKKS